MKKEETKDARKALDEGREKTAMIQIVEIYGTTDSLPEAVDMWRRLKMMDYSQCNRIRVWGGDIPAYTAYAGILWEEGAHGEAMRLLQKTTVVIPRYSDADDHSGGINLGPYLKVLL